MGKTTEREQIAPSLDLEIVNSIFFCGVLKDRKEMIEDGFVNREKEILAAYLLQKWVNKGDSCWWKLCKRGLCSRGFLLGVINPAEKTLGG